MKILAIRLKNLASLAGPFELDFTAEPLASAGLFAITGPTGAGKSTLLDALCLALFGAVPRLNNIGRETKVPEVDGEISTSDPRTLLRRGTGSGFAEVDFVGIDGHRYRARWDTNRAREKPNGKLQGSRQSLYDLDQQQLLSNQSRSEYKQLIEAKLGLNFEQFTRAVMLAQSEFSAFLKADDKDRSELLEKLTNTAIYSQLGRRAFTRSKEAEDVCKQLALKAEGSAALEPEARAALDLSLEQAQAQLKLHQGQLRQLEQQQQWLNELQRLQDLQSSAAEQLLQAQQQRADQQAQRLQLSRLEQLAPQRHLFVRHTELQTQLSPLAAQMGEQRQQLESARARADQLEQQLQTAQAQRAAAQQRRSEAAPGLRQAMETEHGLALLRDQTQQANSLRQEAEQAVQLGREALQGLRARQEQSNTRLAGIAEQLAESIEWAPLAEAWPLHRERLQQVLKIASRLHTGQGELPALQQRAASAEQALGEQRASLEILYREAGAESEAVGEQVQTLASLLQDSHRQQHSLQELQRLWQAQHSLDQRLAELQQRLHEAQQQREQLNREGLEAREQLKVAEQTLTITREVLERQRLARSASVEELRAQLQDDQPCPVCGSQEHPYHQPEALLQSLGRHDESEEAQARAQVEALKETLAQLREKAGGLIARQKELLGQQDTLNQERQTLAPSLEAHPLYPQLADQAVDQRAAWLTLRLGQLQQRIAQDEQRQGALLALQKDAARLQQQLRASEQASQAASQQWVEQTRQLTADRQRLDEELDGFSSLLCAATLQRLRDEPTTTFMQLDRQVSQHLAYLEQQRDEQQEQSERQKTLDLQQVEQLNREHLLGERQQRCALLESQAREAQQQLEHLLAGQPSAAQWQLQLEQALDQARQAETDSAQALQAVRDQLIQLDSDLKARQERLASLEQEYRDLSNTLDEWRRQHPDLDEANLGQLLSFDDGAISALRQHLQLGETAVEQAQVRVQEREQTLHQHLAQRNGQHDAEALLQALNERQGQLTQSEQQCAELRAQQAEDQRRQHANQALQAQSAAANAEYRRWARLSELIGSATGDRFRKIAQAYNLDLLVHHANAQLQQLARRYRLKRGGSMLGLLVLDTEMGDELRSVHSLSGGETFLVSLALALGLASMASSTLKIESLFIDEGFGSLDPQSLQLAMDALDGLQAQGRKVAVISHVQEMHERIPVQIQVRRQGNGLSTLEVI